MGTLRTRLELPITLTITPVTVVIALTTRSLMHMLLLGFIHPELVAQLHAHSILLTSGELLLSVLCLVKEPVDEQ